MSKSTEPKTTGPKSRPEQLLGVSLFSRRPAIGGRAMHPLSGGRAAILEERGNPIVVGVRAGEEVSSWVVYELMLVATLDAEELVDLSMLDDAGWRRAVKRFAMEVSDADLNEFWVVVEAELEAIRQARAVPAKKTTGRRTRR